MPLRTQKSVKFYTLLSLEEKSNNQWSKTLLLRGNNRWREPYVWYKFFGNVDWTNENKNTIWRVMLTCTREHFQDLSFEETGIHTFTVFFVCLKALSRMNVPMHIYTITPTSSSSIEDLVVYVIWLLIMTAMKPVFDFQKCFCCCLWCK